MILIRVGCRRGSRDSHYWLHVPGKRSVTPQSPARVREVNRKGTGLGAVLFSNRLPAESLPASPVLGLRSRQDSGPLRITREGIFTQIDWFPDWTGPVERCEARVNAAHDFVFIVGTTGNAFFMPEPGLPRARPAVLNSRRKLTAGEMPRL